MSAMISNTLTKWDILNFTNLTSEQSALEIEKQAWLARLVETWKIESEISWNEKGRAYWEKL